MKIHLSKPEHSYLIGLVQADGHLQESSRNRGKLTIELRGSDVDILDKLKEVIPVHSGVTCRTRDTNFKKGYTSCCLSVFDLGFRKEVSQYVPVGIKSFEIRKPAGAIDKDYFRGLIDGDGSMGFTAKGFPFVSLITASEQCALDYIKFIKEITGKTKTTSRNKRDEVYNIMVCKEDAQKLVRELYYRDCISLNRKRIKAEEIQNWIRPKDMRVRTFKRWDTEQDAFILDHGIEESMNELDRSRKSIETRLWRLSK